MAGARVCLCHAEVERTWDEAFKSVDKDGNGALDFDEFIQLYEVIKAKIVQHMLEQLEAVLGLEA